MLGLCFNPTGFSELGSLLGVRRFCSPLDFAALDQEANLLTVASFGLQGSPGRCRYSCTGMGRLAPSAFTASGGTICWYRFLVSWAIFPFLLVWNTHPVAWWKAFLSDDLMPCVIVLLLSLVLLFSLLSGGDVLDFWLWFLEWHGILVFNILPMPSWAGNKCAVGYYGTSEDHDIRLEILDYVDSAFDFVVGWG